MFWLFPNEIQLSGLIKLQVDVLLGASFCSASRDGPCCWPLDHQLNGFSAANRWPVVSLGGLVGVSPSLDAATGAANAPVALGLPAWLCSKQTSASTISCCRSLAIVVVAGGDVDKPENCVNSTCWPSDEQLETGLPTRPAGLKARRWAREQSGVRVFCAGRAWLLLLWLLVLLLAL